MTDQAFVAFVALGSLTSNEREAFIDHELIHDTYESIGKRMGISRGRAQQLAKRAREKLTEKVAA